jgi:hypothetical protein
MRTGVACGAECNQVLRGIIAGMTPKLFVVDLQVRHPAARLTLPAIATQHLLPQTLIRKPSQSFEAIPIARWKRHAQHKTLSLS